ncbi:unnamed protein product [Didymodactylos carnosus]|uniref:DUF4371 domain-containing protein n=1 Tax=Didymodactylos carnosus TaxID=1234261 RepID=A0A814E5I0_9BILA|nr:unnamed protein product [Didymodactylos carnosus]CAF3738647.1 unnamed protein product [Didymodactylos carnosus]
MKYPLVIKKISIFTNRFNVSGKVNTAIMIQLLTETEYWEKVLLRIVSVIKFLSSRGLAFRGSNQIIGDNHNGNYLGCLELISNFDPFLHEHLKSYGNKGKGNVSYLSNTVCDEFIEVMGNHVRKLIVKLKKYYSIIIDSTSDIAHIDQLTFVVRYVDPSGSAVERFLMFIENVGHKSSAMEDAILNEMDVLEINLNDCRGQSYDNAANMSGAYSELQSRIRARNDLAVYVSCAVHSLNLSGECAAEC